MEDNVTIDPKKIRGAELIRSRIGIIGGPCDCSIEPPCFISHGVSYLLRYVVAIVFL